VIGRPDLADDLRLDTNEKRADALRTLIVPVLEEWAAVDDLDARDAAARLNGGGQPAGVVQTVDEVRTDPQLEHRGMFQRLVGPDADLRIPRFPLLIDGQALPSGPVPALGADNAEFGFGGGAG
jgi:crotonobetainyl-CoA:carnitine CoA-transferase CaiB-like acyl-CoA transferase